MECGRLEAAPQLSKPAPLLPSVSVARWKEGKNSFGTCSEKSLSFPGGNLSVWGILAAALPLHKHPREGAAVGATPLPHASRLPLAGCFRNGDQNVSSCSVPASHDAHVISRVC